MASTGHPLGPTFLSRVTGTPGNSLAYAGEYAEWKHKLAMVQLIRPLPCFGSQTVPGQAGGAPLVSNAVASSVGTDMLQAPHRPHSHLADRL